MASRDEWAEERLYSLSQLLHEKWKAEFPVSEETVRSVRECVEKQWMQEQEQKRAAEYGGPEHEESQGPEHDSTEQDHGQSY